MLVPKHEIMTDSEIEDLKNNEFNFYIPSEYINKKHFYK